jgi:hypothetical protein
VYHPPALREASPARHRTKAGPLTLGATRSRLIQVVRHLGIYEVRIAARLREEQRTARLLEERRLARLREEPRATRSLEERKLARLHVESRAARVFEARNLARSWGEERAALSIEQRRFVLLLKEELTFESMTEDQRSTERLEEQIVSWLMADDSGD